MRKYVIGYIPDNPNLQQFRDEVEANELAIEYKIIWSLTLEGARHKYNSNDLSLTFKQEKV